MPVVLGDVRGERIAATGEWIYVLTSAPKVRETDLGGIRRASVGEIRDERLENWTQYARPSRGAASSGRASTRADRSAGADHPARTACASGTNRAASTRRSANEVSGCQSTTESIMDARSAAVDGRSRRNRSWYSPQKPSAALPDLSYAFTFVRILSTASSTFSLNPNALSRK